MGIATYSNHTDNSCISCSVIRILRTTNISKSASLYIYVYRFIDNHRYTFTCILKHVHIRIYTYTKEHLLAGWATANASRDATTSWDFDQQPWLFPRDLPSILAIHGWWESSRNMEVEYGIGFTTFIGINYSLIANAQDRPKQIYT